MRVFVYFIYSMLALIVTGIQFSSGAELDANIQPQPVSDRPADSEVTKAIENWRRQKIADKLAQEKGTILAPKSMPRMDERTLNLGGPGLDGGGGVSVLLSNGQLRLLDLAKGSGLSLKSFDRADYEKIMTSKRKVVSNVGTVVPSAQFFSCAIQKMSRQDNLLLQFLRPENINLTVVVTDLPLKRTNQNLSTVVFPSPLEPNFAYQSTQLPMEDLLSPSVSANYQRPIASYGFQEIGPVKISMQVLLISSQLYSALSKEDQCGLQVHELLRYVANFGKMTSFKMPYLIKRKLSTKEIEKLTYKIMNEQPVYLSEIPATNYYKALAMASSNWTMDDYHACEQAGIFPPEDDSLEISAGTMSLLLEMSKNAMRSSQILESASLNISREIRREQKKLLRGKRVHLRDVLD